MAVSERNPLLPDFDRLDLSRVAYAYDRESDSLVIHLYGRGRPATVYQTVGGVDLRLDPETDAIIGAQIEGYLTFAVLRQPYLLNLARAAGIGWEEIEAAEARIEQHQREAWRATRQAAQRTSAISALGTAIVESARQSA